MGATCEKIHPTSPCTIVTKKLIGARAPTFITEQQKTLIRENWQILKEHIANVGVITFVSMFSSRPELKEIFNKFRGKDMSELKHSGLVRAHALNVMAMVDKCVSRLDVPSNLSSILGDVRRSHRKNNVQLYHVKSIFPHFLAAIKPYIEENWSDENAEAWRKLFDLLIYYLSEGS